MEMDMSVFKEILDQFYDIGGIKVMITGGEPFLHSEINNILKTSADYGIRVELLTNGTVINEEHAKIIRKYVDEVQISVDGLKGHEMLRGEGTLEKTLKGIKLLDDMDISIATMITKFNLNEFDELEQLVKEVDASRWLLDYPCTDESILPPFRDAAEIMRRYGYGKESYESSLKLTCGTHLCAVTPDGLISRCGFYEPIGSIEDSLLECWRKICAKYLWNIEELECKCEHLETCKGGCRYRAEYFGYGKLGKDPLMCCYFES
jgi:radical SAM protein with 4Fe4S-binding SPASM domain